MATQAIPQIADDRSQLRSFKKLLVAHDFSPAADRALTDAMAISGQFHAEIVVAHVEGPINEIHSDINTVKQARAAMEDIRNHVALADHPCKVVVRAGAVAKTLVDISLDECPDLLLLGAYGNGSKDRATLGSTAELLLRSIWCPVLTYGPKVTGAIYEAKKPMRILVPFELPCLPEHVGTAVQIAKLFKAELELLHVVDVDHSVSMPHAFQDTQYGCEKLVQFLRDEGLQVKLSVLFGEPEEAIVSRSQETNSFLIVMPLEMRGRLSSATSDNVAVRVIRNAQVPVVTYRIDWDRNAEEPGCKYEID